jgi:hypothetical protein
VCGIYAIQIQTVFFNLTNLQYKMRKYNQCKVTTYKSRTTKNCMLSSISFFFRKYSNTAHMLSLKHKHTSTPHTICDCKRHGLEIRCWTLDVKTTHVHIYWAWKKHASATSHSYSSRTNSTYFHRPTNRCQYGSNTYTISRAKRKYFLRGVVLKPWFLTTTQWRLRHNVKWTLRDAQMMVFKDAW